MGINIILPLIMGIAMTAIIGSQVAPSYIEKIKIAKVENRTISNQNLIKDAIVRYIKLEKKVPKDNDLEVLNKAGLLMDYHESNLFGGGYGFTIDEKKGTLKIFTTINDEGASKYFSNSFKFPNKPNCVEITTIKVNGVNVETCKDNIWETFYLLDEETFKALPPPEVGSIEWVEDKYSKENLGDRYEEKEIPLVGGEIDYVVDVPNNKVIEYIYDIDKKVWVESGTSFGGNFTNDPIPNIIEFAEKYPNLNNYIKANPTIFKTSFLSQGSIVSVPFIKIVGTKFNNNEVTKELYNFIIKEKEYFLYGHTNYYPEQNDTYPYPIDYSFKSIDIFPNNDWFDYGYLKCDGTKWWVDDKNETPYNNYSFLFLYPSGTCGGTIEEKSSNRTPYYYATKIHNFFNDFNNQINIAPLFQNP